MEVRRAEAGVIEEEGNSVVADMIQDSTIEEMKALAKVLTASDVLRGRFPRGPTGHRAISRSHEL